MTDSSRRDVDPFATKLVAPLQLTKFADPLPIPPVIRPGLCGSRTIRLQVANRQLHSELPPTRLWTYNGHFPGPTIEVRRGQRLRVRWTNQLSGALPLTGVEVDHDVQQPGRGGATPRTDLADIPPWTVVHAHGILTGASNDGWPENGVLPGDSQLTLYPNDQPAGTFWYHDHAMGITRWSVLVGLAGLYLIRDHEELALHLPRGAQEIPLIIADRNLDVDEAGHLTGNLLYKIATFQVTPQHLTVPFSGPFTLVNGTIWPHLVVTPRWYRFRLVNASNARTYALALTAATGESLPGVMQQIGSDAGLLPTAITVDTLMLAPGERADVLVNFAAFRGQHLRMVNTLNPPPEPGTTTPNPAVMEFRVGQQPVSDPFTLPPQISSSFVRLTHTSHPHGHRWVVITPPGPGHPEMWEMEQIDPTGITFPTEGVVQIRTPDGELRTLKRTARHFQDPPTFVFAADSWQQVTFVHLGGPGGHPMHIHLTRFQALVRDLYDIHTYDAVTGGTVTPLERTSVGVIDPNEQGWKDVIRVGPGQLVTVLGQFEGGTGRYLYHCHIFEHEDEAMMRPLLVLPEAVLALDPHHGGGPHPHS